MNTCTTYISLCEIVDHNTGPTAHNFDYQVAILEWITARLNALPNLLVLECEMCVVALTSGTLRPAIEVHVRQSLIEEVHQRKGTTALSLSYVRSSLLSAARTILREASAAEFAAHVLASAVGCTQLRINALRRQIRNAADSLSQQRLQRMALDRADSGT
ncbi:hypothetical protein DB346_22430 [Verrucomicrobia bacterium LW23]|nr:hypothetical protein DB346_22430 [Verrucomicrobia bacterium LW23]